MKKLRLFALAAVLGFTALSQAHAAGGVIVPIETFCMCACPDGIVYCIGSPKGDCSECGPFCANHTGDS